VIVASVVAVTGVRYSRGQALRRRFGPEYDRLAQEAGPRQARAELTRRQRLFDQLGIRPLTPEQRARYEGEWTAAQERFVEDPAQAARAAAALVIAVARDRGFSANDEAKLLTELSTGYSRELDGYRRALEATARLPEAGTEELREAVIGYRAMFHELLGYPDGAAGTTAETASTASTATPNSTTASTSPVGADADNAPGR
jgi:hypothetical protein